jgi:hypothetical protein
MTGLLNFSLIKRKRKNLQELSLEELLITNERIEPVTYVKDAIG